MPDRQRTLVPPLLYFWRNIGWGTLHWSPRCPAAFFENPGMYGWKLDPMSGAMIWDGQNMGLRILTVGKSLRHTPAGLGTIVKRRGRRVCVSCYMRERNMAQQQVMEELREAILAAKEEEGDAPGDSGAAGQATS